MVRKNNPSRVWQQSKQDNDINRGSSNSRNEIKSDEESLLNGSQNDSEYDYSSNDQNSEKKQMKLSRQQELQSQNSPNKNDQHDFFEITDKLIHQLNEEIYKSIVLPQFIQGNSNIQAQCDTNILQNQKHESEISPFKTRIQQIEKIKDFIFSESLDPPSYFRPLKRSKGPQNEKLLSQIETKVWGKRDALVYFNTTLLQPSNIKFLNIYGPTGSGKNFTLKSIITRTKFASRVIWINGMNIMSGKTKKFISDLKEKFDSMIWQKYKQTSISNSFSQENFLNSFLGKQNEKVLILDEYDQINDFQLTNLLKYAYIKGFQDETKIKCRKEIFRISKILFVSNNFSSTDQFMSRQQQRMSNKATSNKSLYIEHLIFRPYTERQAEQILREKITTVNIRFCAYANQTKQLKDIFVGNLMKGIFTDKKIIHVIKKVCMSEEIDIRKLMLFYANSFKDFVQFIQEFQQNQSKCLPQSCRNLMKKQFEYLINDDFLTNQSLCIQNSNNSISGNQDDSIPISFYLSQLQPQGKSILKAIYETLKFKKRLLNFNHKKQHTINNQKNPIQSGRPFEFDMNFKLTSQRKRENSLRLSDFYRKIRPKTEYHKIFPWIYEWQQINLMKIIKGNHNSNFSEDVGIERSPKIKIAQDYQIQVLDPKLIQQSLNLNY